MVNLLLSRGADTSLIIGGDTVLSSALFTTRPDRNMIENLVKNNCPIREKDVLRAAEKGDHEIFRLLYSPDFVIDPGKLIQTEAASIAVLNFKRC